jgi:hypothetical protein
MYIQVAIGEISCADTGLEKETFLFVVKLSYYLFMFYAFDSPLA